MFHKSLWNNSVFHLTYIKQSSALFYETSQGSCKRISNPTWRLVLEVNIDLLESISSTCYMAACFLYEDSLVFFFTISCAEISLYNFGCNYTSSYWTLAHFHSKASKLYSAKDACKMLVKLTPVIHFTNILRAAYLPIFFLSQKTQTVSIQYRKDTNNTCTKKAAHKMLVKLTPSVLLL